MADRRLCSFLFPFVLGFRFFAFAKLIANLKAARTSHDPDEGSTELAHGALLVAPKTLAQCPLQYLAGTVLGQIGF
jgi:hypothetical protein